MDIMLRQDKEGQILVYFPYEISDSIGSGTCLTEKESHSACSHEWILRATKPYFNINKLITYKGAFELLKKFYFY